MWWLQILLHSGKYIKIYINSNFKHFKFLKKNYVLGHAFKVRSKLLLWDDNNKSSYMNTKVSLSI